jgi:MurNAc alpha-1-phosphate uridylyltransferase
LEKENATLDIPCIILAAGKGERMKPLTDIVPKPLLQVRGKTLLGHHLDALSCPLFKNKVVTAYWLQEQIVDFVKESCKVSREKELLGIAGGIKNALTFINPLDYFIVVNSDVYIPQFNFLEFYNIRYNLRNSDNCQGFLFLTENPLHNMVGDFYLSDDGYIESEGVGKKYTFTGVAMYHCSLFTNVVAGDSLYPLLIKKHKLMGKVMDSDWYDIGTLERFEKINK